jgi:hypothetical protein
MLSVKKWLNISSALTGWRELPSIKAIYARPAGEKGLVNKTADQ